MHCCAGVLLPGAAALAAVGGLVAWRVAVYGRREYIVANMMRKYVPKGESTDSLQVVTCSALQQCLSCCHSVWMENPNTDARPLAASTVRVVLDGRALFTERKDCWSLLGSRLTTDTAWVPQVVHGFCRSTARHGTCSTTQTAQCLCVWWVQTSI